MHSTSYDIYGAYVILSCASQQADAELEFLKKAIGKNIAEKDINKIQKILKDNEIPTEASPVTLALLYKAAEEAADCDDKNQALDCYRMVYDLTADEEIGKIILKLFDPKTMINHGNGV